MCAVAMENFVLEEGTYGFEPHEVTIILKEYVCSVCHADLKEIQLPNSRMSVIVCYEHGNVEKCGRIMRSSVSIMIEKGLLEYKEVIRNLQDLWPDMHVEGFEQAEAMSICKHYVCKCGARLFPQFKNNDFNSVVIMCLNRHNIEEYGYKKRGGRK